MAAPAYPYAAFFGPWEPLPTAAAAPTEQTQLDRINLLIRHCLQNGPSFLSEVKQKQQNDQTFAFLFGGDNSQYFKWALFCATNASQPGAQPQHQPPQQTPAQPAMHQQFHMQPQVSMAGPPHAPYPTHAQATPQQTLNPAAQPAQPTPSVSMQLPPEVESGFTQVLDALTGSKESIKTSQQWFMACGPSAAPGLSRMIAMRCCSQGLAYDKQLHCIYLCNDILFKSFAARTPGSGPASDPIAVAMQPFLGAMLAAAFIGGGRGDEVAQKLTKMLDFWSERQVFDSSTIQMLQQTMKGTDNPSAALAIAVAQQVAAAAARVAAAQPPAAQPPAAPHPPAYPPPQAPMPGYQPQAGVANPWGQPVGPAGAPPGVPFPQHPAMPGMQPMQGMPGVMPMGGWQQPMGGMYGHHPMSHMMGAPHMGYGQMPHPHMQAPQHHPQDPDWGMPPQGGTIMKREGRFRRDRSSSRSSRSSHSSRSSSRSSRSSRSRSRSSSRDSKGEKRVKRERVSRFTSVPVAPNHFPQPDIAASPSKRVHTEDTREPVSSFSFPPGLLPALCKKRREEEGAKPYEPLLPSELEEFGLPPPPVKDDYLASRMERFYAEIRDYRPGITRADVEDPNHSWHRNRLRKELQLLDDGTDLGGKQPWWRGGGRRQASKEAAAGRVMADGSFAGAGGNMYAGLGTHVVASDAHPSESEGPQEPVQTAVDSLVAAGLDDAYLAYRMRGASGYHATIMANAAKAQMGGTTRRATRPRG